VGSLANAVCNICITSEFLVIREKSRKGQKTRPFYHLMIYMKQPPEWWAPEHEPQYALFIVKA